MAADTDLVTLDEVKAYLGLAATDTVEDAKLQALISACSLQLEQDATAIFIIRELVEPAGPPPMNPYNLPGPAGGASPYYRGGRLYLRYSPMNAYDDGTYVRDIVDPAGFHIPPTDYVVEPEHALLIRPGGWLVPQTPSGIIGRWLVTYKPGHWANTAAVAASAKLACNMLVAMRREMPVPGIQSKTRGTVSTTYKDTDDAGIPAEIRGLLGPWRSIDVG